MTTDVESKRSVVIENTTKLHDDIVESEEIADRRHVHPSPPSITDNSSDIPYKDRETYDLAEDVYAFIVAAPVFSTPFALAIGVIITK